MERSFRSTRGGRAAASQMLVGQTVEITGETPENAFEGKPDIELTDPPQLVIK